MHLLAVDDDPITRSTLEVILTTDGHTVTVAENGEVALSKLKEEQVDLVITDVYMPEMDGLRLRDIVRELQGTSRTPFLFVSGCDDQQFIVTDPGCEGFFKKGRPLTEMLSWITYLTSPLDKRSSTRPDIQDDRPAYGETFQSIFIPQE